MTEEQATIDGEKPAGPRPGFYLAALVVTCPGCGKHVVDGRPQVVGRAIQHHHIAVDCQACGKAFIAQPAPGSVLVKVGAPPGQQRKPDAPPGMRRTGGGLIVPR